MFHRAILQSGSALDPAMMASSANAFRISKSIGKQLNCFSNQPRTNNIKSSNGASAMDSSGSVDESSQDSPLRSNPELLRSDSLSSKPESILERRRASASLLDCVRSQKLERLLSLNIRPCKFLYSYSPTLDGILLPSDPAAAMQDKHSSFGSFDLMLGVDTTSLNEYFPKLAGQQISIERKERITRTLVRNLYSYHLQVSNKTCWHTSFVHC